MSLKKWPTGFPGACPDCGVTIGPNDPRYRSGNAIYCVTDGARRIAEEYSTRKAPSGAAKASTLPPPVPGEKTPTGAVLPPPVTNPGPVTAVQTGERPPVRVKVGITLGLPQYSAIRCDIESDGVSGEPMERVAERVSEAVWAQARRDLGKVVAALADVHGFLEQGGQKAEGVRADD